VTIIRVTTQVELDDALMAAIDHETEIIIESPEAEWISIQTSKKIYVVAWGSSHVVARESSHVVARGSSHVEARGSSHVVAWGSSHVEAWESSHVEAWGSSHVEAWESSHVVAWESSHVEARGSVQIRAVDAVEVTTQSKFVVVTQHHPAAQITGPAVIIPVAPIRTAEDWIVYYGAQSYAEDMAAVVLYKAVRDDYHSSHGFLYQPGTTPQAPDWDGGKAECGGGLHFCAHPLAALDFDSQATRFIACPVLITSVVVHKHAQYPSKVKAPGVCAPCWEVDRTGKSIETEVPPVEEEVLAQTGMPGDEGGA
jgi:hypothetical protein